MLKILEIFREAEVRIRPIGKRVLVIEEKRASGLILPGSSEERTIKYGRVTAVGGSVKEVAVGERVIFEGRSGRSIEDEGSKYILLELEEILAVAEGER